MPCTSDYITRRRLLLSMFAAIVILLICVSVAVPLASSAKKKNRSSSSLETAKKVLEKYPLVDGHNDFPYIIRLHGQVRNIDFNSALDKVWNKSHTDIPRLRKGMVGAQFWVAYVSCGSQYKDAVTKSLEQVDIVKNLVAKYPDTFEFVTTAKGIEDAFRHKKIGSLIGLEGGQSIDSSLGVLRMFYELGVRYMTVTHSCNTPWADNWKTDNDNSGEHDGLTPFGKKVIHEMNRLGMLVDLSHVSVRTMEVALDITKSPVIFSHSSVYTLCNHYRNVPDKILKKTKENKGVVMVNFYSNYTNCFPKKRNDSTLSQIADHIDYIKDLIGADYVGIGGDYDGVDTLPVGLEDVSKYPDLFAVLVTRGWTDEDLGKLAGGNLIRVFKAAEKVRDEMASEKPDEDMIPDVERKDKNCSTTYK